MPATGAFGYTLGGPVGAFIAATVSAEVGRVITGKTKVDIVLVPLASIIAGGLITLLVGPAVDALMTGLGNAINSATELQPLPMGIIVSVSMGMILTLPISSAALSIMMGLSGIAAGAATVGCSAQMVGFAVMSFRENRWGGLIAPRVGYVYAAGAEYFPKADPLAAHNTVLRDSGARIYDGVPYGEQRYRCRYGDVRTGGTDIHVG